MRCMDYSSSFLRLKPRLSSLNSTSSSDFLPRLRTFIISSVVLFVRSSTVLIPALFRQLNERTERSSSSIVISRTFSLPFSSLNHNLGVCNTVGEVHEEVEMLAEHLSRQRNRFLSVDNAVCPNVEVELVVVSNLTYTGIIYCIINL